jgi:glyoxylase-like metal-dependent hydrolase (beta-lactamase superfamily II)
MRVFKDLYFYPWMSYQENNANTVFINGPVPTIVDPGHSHLFSNVAEAMLRDGADAGRVKLVLLTHGHPDHVEATDRFDDSVIRGISEKEFAYMQKEGKELFLATGAHLPARPFKILLKEGELRPGDTRCTVIPTPGHSPGSICLYNEEEKVLISGDTLFNMGVGRTDLPGGDTDQLADSIRRLASLDIDYVLPGHGEMVKGRKAVQKNFQAVLSEFFG